MSISRNLERLNPKGLWLYILMVNTNQNLSYFLYTIEYSGIGRVEESAHGCSYVPLLTLCRLFNIVGIGLQHLMVGFENAEVHSVITGKIQTFRWYYGASQRACRSQIIEERPRDIMTIADFLHLQGSREEKKK